MGGGGIGAHFLPGKYQVLFHSIITKQKKKKKTVLWRANEQINPRTVGKGKRGDNTTKEWYRNAAPWRRDLKEYW